MSCSCSPKNQVFQPVPTTGPLKRNLNLPFDRLLRIVEGEDERQELRCYVISSIAKDENRGMVQKGSGPNIMGGVITLCTCKHQMRTYHSPEDWRGVWIIGISGKRGNSCRAVFYMMKVKEAFESHLDLWSSSQLLSDRAKRVKAAHRHVLGDLFQPIRHDRDQAWSTDNYREPKTGHSHEDEWPKDINTDGKSGRRPALLVGDPELSFVWNKPMVYPRFEKWEKLRNNKRGRLRDFEHWFGSTSGKVP